MMQDHRLAGGIQAIFAKKRRDYADQKVCVCLFCYIYMDHYVHFYYTQIFRLNT